MTYAGLNAATNTELAKIEQEDARGQLARAALNSGLGPVALPYFVKAVRHGLGHKAKRGDGIVPLPTPPAGLKPGELAFIDQRVRQAVDALTPPAPAGPPPPIPPDDLPDTANRTRGRTWGES